MRKAVLTTAAVSAACLLALAGCGSNSTDEGTEEAAPTAITSFEPSTAPATPSETASAPSATASASSSVRQIRLVVADGKVSGDTGIVKLSVGEPFQVTVTSDVADEVHVHNETRAGESGDVEAGGTVTIDASVGAPGEYEVELEGRRLTLTRLQVT